MKPRKQALKLAVLFAALSLAMTTPAYSPSKPYSGFERSASNTAIVVFTGESRRIIEGLRLYMNGVADKIFISGIDAKNEDILELYSAAGHTPTRGLEGVYIDTQAQTTYENAINTRRWVKDQNIGSILLVTSDFHIPRSRLLLERELRQTTIRTETFSVPSNASEATRREERSKYAWARWGVPTNAIRLVQLMF